MDLLPFFLMIRELKDVSLLFFFPSHNLDEILMLDVMIMVLVFAMFSKRIVYEAWFLQCFQKE
jgi:hypothetical protein